MTTTLTLTSPAQIVEAVPHLLGYHPADSLVFVCLRGGVLLVTARLDLTPTADGAHTFIAQMQHHDADSLLVIAYSNNPGTAAAALASIELLPLDNVQLLDLIAVTDGQWTSQLNSDSGTLNRYGPIAAEAAFAGLAAAPSRTDLLRCIQPDPDHTDTVAHHLDASRDKIARSDHEQRRAHLAALLDTADNRTLTDPETADVITLLADPRTRDVAIIRLTRDDARTQFAAWATIARHTPDPEAAHVLGCTGLAAWLAHEGTVARGCIERAEHAHLTSPTLTLLSVLLDNACPPHIWDTLRAKLAAH